MHTTTERLPERDTVFSTTAVVEEDVLEVFAAVSWEESLLYSGLILVSVSLYTLKVSVLPPEVLCWVKDKISLFYARYHQYVC